MASATVATLSCKNRLDVCFELPALRFITSLHCDRYSRVSESGAHYQLGCPVAGRNDSSIDKPGNFFVSYGELSVRDLFANLMVVLHLHQHRRNRFLAG